MYIRKLINLENSIALVLGLCALPCSCRSAPGPSPGSYRLAPLFAAADAVCWGTVASIAEVAVQPKPTGGTLVSRSMRFLPARCYKGDIAASDQIRYERLIPPVSLRDVSANVGDSGLVFLKRVDGGTLEFADPFWGWLRDASLRLLAPESASGMGQLEIDVLLNVQRAPDMDLRIRDLRMLHGFDELSSETSRSVRLLAEDGEPRVAMGAFSILVKSGQPDDLANLCRYVAGGGDAIEHAVQMHNFTALEKLRDPASRLALECIARSGITPLNAPAMAAIRAIASPSSVPELIRRLDDPNPVMQYLAVIALSEITHRPDELGPLMPEFMREPARFRDSWKLWWNDKGHVLYPEAAK
jgi:hypothetical protein